jgi:hypothetical protein
MSRVRLRTALALAVATPIFAGIGNIGWSFAGDLYERGRLWWILKNEPFKVQVSKKFGELSAVAGFQCLLVRFGEEKYLQILGTEKDKIDGQRRLELIPVTLSTEGGNYFLEFTLPIHPFLGTQFKLFANPTSGVSAESAKQQLQALTEDLDDVTVGGTHADKVYFLLKKFWPTKAEGILDGKVVNNFVAPR